MSNKHDTQRAPLQEPIDITIVAGGVENLVGYSVHMFAWKDGEQEMEIDGAACTIPDTAVLAVRIDPRSAGAGGAAALTTGGLYRFFVRLTAPNGQVSRYPKGYDLTMQLLPARDDGS